MSKHSALPIALTIAGSDSGGGAGVQADLKTFAALGVHGVCAITCLTAQNPRVVRGIEAARPAFVRAQLDAVFEELAPSAAKTGLLCSAETIRVVAKFFRQRNRPPLVVDPVMVATSGRRLLDAAAVEALRHELLPLAVLVTPNLPEAEILTGHRIDSIEALRSAAREIHGLFGCAALVKGGHLRGVREAVDFFHDGRTELMLSAPFVRGVKTHGTGCTYSAAITAHLSRGCWLAEAVSCAKQFVTSAIAGSRRVRGHQVLGWFA